MAFDGSIQTGTRSSSIDSDSTPLYCGSLSPGAIASSGALAGTSGSDVLLLNGDRDRQMNGSESTRITANRSHTVLGDQDKTIKGNKTEQVVSNNEQTTVGNLQRTTVGSTNDSFVDVHTIEHKAEQMLSEAVSYYHDIKEKLDKVQIRVDDFLDYQLHSVSVQNFIGYNIDFKGVQNAVIGLLAEKHFVCASEKDIDAQLKQLNAKIGELKSEIGAIEPVVYITKVHEVSITQKLLVIGINQFM